MTDELRYTFEVDAAEQFAAVQLLAARSRWHRLNRIATLPFLLLPFLAALVLHWPLHILWPFGVLLLLELVAVGIYPVLQRRRHARALAEYPHLRQLTYRLAPDGLHLSTALTSTRLAWEAVTEARETTDLFVLFAGNRLAYYIPRRVVADTATRLRSFLRMTLGDRANAIMPPSSPLVI